MPKKGDKLIDCCFNKDVHYIVELFLKEAFKKLEPREKMIFDFRFPKNEKDFLSYKQVGEHFGKTPERIRQIEAKAMEKIKKYILDKIYG